MHEWCHIVIIGVQICILHVIGGKKLDKPKHNLKPNYTSLSFSLKGFVQKTLLTHLFCNFTIRFWEMQINLLKSIIICTVIFSPFFTTINFVKYWHIVLSRIPRDEKLNFTFKILKIQCICDRKNVYNIRIRVILRIILNFIKLICICWKWKLKLQKWMS